MNVVAVTLHYPNESMVGAWLATHSFLRLLVDRGHTVTVFSAYGSRSGTLDGVYVVSGRQGWTFFNQLAADADVLVCHAGFVKPVDDWRNQKPIVCMVHGLERPDTFDGLTPVFNAFNNVGRFDGDHVVCHPVLDVERHKVVKTGEHFTIINLSKEKGVETVWGAARLLPDHKFLGVKGGYGHQVVPPVPWFTVRSSTPSMKQVWSETKVLLAPSHQETWGMTGLEAGINGIPVIAYPNDGFKESVGDSALIVDSLDSDDWVDAINQISDLSVCKKWSDRILERANYFLSDIQPASSARFVSLVEGL